MTSPRSVGRRGLLVVAAALAVALVVGAAALAGEGEELFETVVRPYLVERCYECHAANGVHEEDLAVDSAAGMRTGGASGPAVVPGDPGGSRIIAALEHADGLLMPKGGPKPAPRIVAAFRRWIELGAPDSRSAPLTAAELAAETSWERVVARRRQWWSLQPIRRPAVPPRASADGNEIDAFIGRRLAEEGLAPSPPADRRTLIRRLSFDLTGLPPDPAEVEAFVADESPRAYDDLIDRLLASPRYGERWGRHWLDVVRYTESQGFEYDHPRDRAWHYRDWVIRSFNDDLPYDRFMKAQIAGDVLEPVTTDGIVAASLLTCGAWDQAGNNQANATQRAATREEEMEDMLSVVGQTFLGLSLNCARCHAHKFDPISHEEYYRVRAVFDGVKHGERTIATPAEVRTHEERMEGLRRELAEARSTIERIEAVGRERVVAKRKDAGVVAAGPAPLIRFAFDEPSSPAIAGGTLHGDARIADGRLWLSRGKKSYFESAVLPRTIGAKTLEAWVALADLDQRGGAAISIERIADRDFDAIVFGERQPRRWMPGSGGFRRTRDPVAADETAEPGRLVHVAIVYDVDGGIAAYRDGVPYGSPYTPAEPPAVFEAGGARLLLGLRHEGAGNGFLDGAIASAAIYDRPLSADEVAASFRSGGASIPLEETLAELDDAARAERTAAVARVRMLEADLEAGKTALPVSYAGVRVQPSPARVLARGDVRTPGDVVSPGALSAVPGLPADLGLEADAAEAERRRRFADWLADPRNPLPARVMANRVWQFHFGAGLVTTPSDFGAAGSPPTHPELLDWLAARFIDDGWSVKSLHRLIVRSAAYRQSSAANPRAQGIDADDALVWRFAPRRLEAEAVRDAMLAASGLLNLEAGGPSIRPFTTTKFNATFYQPIDGDDPQFNRRTVYRMNVNSGKDPLLDAFDCPDPSVKTPRRGVTITPLQSLSLMNNAFVQRQAAALAARAEAAAPGDPAGAVRAAYRFALGRPATEAEVARAVAAAETGGLTGVCWAVFNSTEFVYVR